MAPIRSFYRYYIFFLLKSPSALSFNLNSKSWTYANFCRLKKGHTFLHSCKTEWIAGDFEKDLSNLEKAVALANAPTNLAQKERLDLLDAFAQSKRLVFKDLFNLVRIIMLNTFLWMGLHKLGRRVSMFFISIMNVSFWTLNIMIPIMLHLLLGNKRSKERRLQNEWEATYIEERDDTSDFARCLLENWFASSMNALLLLCTLFFEQRDKVPSNIAMQYMVFARTISRIGVVSSILQFQEYLYKLNRERTKGPMFSFHAALRTLIAATFHLLPFGLASDLYQYWVLSTGSTALSNSHSCLEIFKKFGVMPSLLFVMKMAQICSFIRLIRIGNYSNVSLSIPNIEAAKMLETNPQMFERKLRYRIRWRQSKRISSCIRSLVKDFTIYIFSGWGDSSAILKETTKPTILKLIEREQGDDLVPLSNTSRTKRLENAQEHMRNIHKTNYNKKIFNDPLGMALQQTFGIGLSFDFDHDSLLKSGEQPSVHRLRARCAKSAIKHYHEIPNLVRLEMSSLDLDSPLSKAILDKEICRRRHQLKLSALQLTKLIPTNAASPTGKDFDILTMKKSEKAFIGNTSSIFQGGDAEISNDDDDDGIYDPYTGESIFIDDESLYA